MSELPLQMILALASKLLCYLGLRCAAGNLTNGWCVRAAELGPSERRNGGAREVQDRGLWGNDCILW